MQYLLDTDTIIYWMKGAPEVADNATRHLTSLAASIITEAELYYGAYRSQQVERNIRAIHVLKNTIVFIPLDDTASELFGKIKADLQKQGIPLADTDILIAANAIASQRTLVTNNIKHFGRISGLRLENWTLPQQRQ